MTAPQPFDSLASAYDDSFTHTPIGRYLRERVHERLERHFRAGDHVLELGCGTGEDALRLAARGVWVLATDASKAMLEAARAKAAGNALVRLEKLDLRQLPVSSFQSPVASSENSSLILHPSSLPFGGVFANFGPLNCLDDWHSLAGWLAERVRPGGIAAFGVMSPFCLWEMAWHGLHGDFGTAFRRWQKNTRFTPATGSSNPPVAMIVQYPTIRRLTRDFAPAFRRVHVEPLGLFLPPSDAFGVVEKRPRLLSLLTSLENRFGKYGKLVLLADHYWVEFRREA